MSPLKYVQNAAHKILIFSRVECYLTLKTGTRVIMLLCVWWLIHIRVMGIIHYTVLEHFGGFHWKAYDTGC